MLMKGTDKAWRRIQLPAGCFPATSLLSVEAILPGQRAVDMQEEEALPNTAFVCLIAESSATSAVLGMKRSRERKAVRQVNKPGLPCWCGWRQQNRSGVQGCVDFPSVPTRARGWELETVPVLLLTVQADLLDKLVGQTPFLTCPCFSGSWPCWL